MDEYILTRFAGILILGVASQWIASRLRLPAILMLLFAGFLAGPITGFLDTDHLLGELLFPFVSVSVGVILFEGGLSLRLSELRQGGRVVRNLISVGALITWVCSTLAAHLILGFNLVLAVQLGAILIVTGPTVIGPLLRHVRPTGRVASVLRWEGILIDPVGATLALLVFEFVLAADPTKAVIYTVSVIALTLLVGGISGYVAARFLEFVIRRYWLPDYLHVPVTLMSVVGVFALANLLQHESGLLATTVMGITLANQKSVSIRHLVEFKENLGVLLVSTLFILLAARVELSDLSAIGPETLLFLVVLILIVRPATIMISTYNSPLTWNERIFLMCMAPRGIVAASVTSVFALRLIDAGLPQAEQLVSVVFVVIVGTCAIYGLTALPVARRLGLAQSNPQGLLIVGGHSWTLKIAQAVQQLGQRVTIVDTNYDNLAAARMMGLPTYYGNILAEETHDDLDLQGIGRLIALTSNDEVNSLAAMSFVETFGRANVFQLATKSPLATDDEAVPRQMRGRLLFNRTAVFDFFEEAFANGGEVKATTLTQEFTYEQYRSLYNDRAIPLFVADPSRSRLYIFTTDHELMPQAGQTIISYIHSSQS